ncbi:hypothetical protein SOM08_04085 [Hydrogenophaga sp. SNF1]|uniref:hypothetical protein n=1 Tax=Hydrogenophaga sp. SNF1 TaxID=3098762 RepID=UPI002ACC2A7B|nr:hypothetical protein [Hydrogenophaga sp. SNF1]WQB84506.1 hypothetical protein SOM08_04085 [Hydrogenophaga sp. SNF1]
MNTRILPLTEAHVERLHQVLDEVAREKRYLAMLQAPPREQTVAFFRDSLRQGNPHVVALLDDEVVGWCDVLPVFGEAPGATSAPWASAWCVARATRAWARP